MLDLCIKRKIWTSLGQVPEGQVVTYGQLAEMSGLSRSHARVVGSFLRHLPSGTGLPWHRVINHKGMIAVHRNTEQYATQRQLLEKEGVRFIQDRIPLKYFQWQGF